MDKIKDLIRNTKGGVFIAIAAVLGIIFFGMLIYGFASGIY